MYPSPGAREIPEKSKQSAYLRGQHIASVTVLSYLLSNTDLAIANCLIHCRLFSEVPSPFKFSALTEYSVTTLNLWETHVSVMRTATASYHSGSPST